MSTHSIQLSSNVEVQMTVESNNKISVQMNNLSDSSFIYKYNGTPDNFFNTQSYLIATACVENYIRTNYKTNAIRNHIDSARLQLDAFFNAASTAFTKTVNTLPATATPVRKQSKKRNQGIRKVTPDLIASVVDQYTNQNRTVNQISKDLNMAPATAARILNKHGYKGIRKDKPLMTARVAATPTVQTSNDLMSALRAVQAPQ